MMFSSPARKKIFPVRSSRRTMLIGKYSLVNQQHRTKHLAFCSDVAIIITSFFVDLKDDINYKIGVLKMTIEKLKKIAWGSHCYCTS